MEQTSKTKDTILEAKNICVIPTDEPESLTNALALFYTLKELGKNVNLLVDELPKRLSFLTPTLDFINSPKNFVISIPRTSADVSQIYYEKNEDNLKIHLTIDQGQIKKENLSFYFEDAKPDLIVTIGVADFQKQLSEKLNSFGFLLGSEILNIDNNLENKKFGGINLIEQKSLSEIVLNLVGSITEKPIDINTANCLLTGLTLYYENFKSSKTNSEVFEIAADLIKKGALNKQIIDNLYTASESEINFLGKIFQNLKTEGGLSCSIIEDNKGFENFSVQDVGFLVEKIKTIGVQKIILILWKNTSSSVLNGIFHSESADPLHRIAEYYKTKVKGDWLFLAINELNANAVKEKVISLLNEKRTNISLYADALK